MRSFRRQCHAYVRQSWLSWPFDDYCPGDGFPKVLWISPLIVGESDHRRPVVQVCLYHRDLQGSHSSGISLTYLDSSYGLDSHSWQRHMVWLVILNQAYQASWYFRALGDIVYLTAVGQSIVVINSAEVAYELFEKRSSIYSDRSEFPMINELYIICAPRESASAYCYIEWVATGRWPSCAMENAGVVTAGSFIRSSILLRR